MARGILSQTYRCYNYINKNPVIDKVRTILQDEDMFNKKKRRMLHEISGVAVATFDGWFEGDTRNPQHASIAATLASIGYEEQFVKTHDINLEKEIIAGRAWLERRRKAKAKAKPNGHKRPTNGAKRGA